MIEEAIDEKELAFLRQMEDHEDEWIAFVEKDGAEIIVGSGRDAVEASRRAEEAGYPDAVLFRVPRFDTSYILTNSPLSFGVDIGSFPTDNRSTK